MHQPSAAHPYMLAWGLVSLDTDMAWELTDLKRQLKRLGSVFFFLAHW